MSLTSDTWRDPAAGRALVRGSAADRDQAETFSSCPVVAAVVTVLPLLERTLPDAEPSVSPSESPDALELAVVDAALLLE